MRTTPCGRGSFSGYNIAYLFMDTVDAPLRRWGSKTGVLCAWGSCVVDMRDAPSVDEGQRRFQALVAQSQDIYPEACRCLHDDMEASLNHLKVPTRHQQYVRTSNLAERAFEEERRRTKVSPHR